MKSSRRIFLGAAGRGLLASCALLVLAVSTTYAQQISGTPGSPSATTTIDGKYLPPPPSKFGGEINLQASQSKPYWPPQVVPPQGAPNILLIMTDDQGYGVSGTFEGDPHTVDGPDRQGWAALHAVPLHGAVLADTGGPDHRAQPSLCRLWRDHRDVHWIPGLRFRHREKQCHYRHDPEAKRVRDILVRQEPQHAQLSTKCGRTL